MVNENNTNYNDKYYILTDDIDLKSKSVNNDGSGWIPIGSQAYPFKGHFDGDGRNISNVMIERAEDYQGLFGSIDGGTVENLYLNAPFVTAGTSDASGGYIGGITGSVSNNGMIRSCHIQDGVIEGTNYVGGVAGYLGGSSSITECRSSAGVNGSAQVGGIVGVVALAGGGISNCIYESNVKGGDSVGGIVGQLSGGIVEYCYAFYTVTASGNYAGGIAGLIQDGATLRNCVALNGKLSGPGVSAAGANAGRIAGDANNGSILEDNMAIESLKVSINGTTKVSLANDSDELDGKDISTGDPFNPSFWTSLGFDEEIWLIEIDDLPKFQKRPDDGIGTVFYLWSIPKAGDVLKIHTTDVTVIDENNGVISRSADVQKINFTITGMEKWSLQKITLMASTESGVDVNIEHSNNREGILEIPADFFGKITIVAESCYKDTYTVLEGSNANYILTVKGNPSINTTSLPNGKTGELYNQKLMATGDTPITWTLIIGNLPNGLELSSSGIISGTPTKKGTYTFTVKAENSTDKDAEETFTITIDDPPVIATYTVTYDSQGGNSVAPQTAEANKTITAPAAPKKTGYSFMGWYKAATGGTKVSFPYTVTKKETLYAQWTANSYTVKFDKNGGTKGSMSNQSFTYDKAQKLTKNKFTRKDYVFAGWAPTKSGKVKYKDNVSVKNVASSGTTSLYAVWTKVSAPTKAPGSVKLNNKKAKQLTVTYKKVSGANGYRIQYTTDRKFKKGIKTKFTTKFTYTITNLKKNTKYYIRVAAYKLDSTNQKVVGKQSSVISKSTKK